MHQIRVQLDVFFCPDGHRRGVEHVNVHVIVRYRL